MKEDLRSRLRSIVFEAETREGRRFDVLLIFAVLASIICVMLESVDGIAKKYAQALYILEWFFTILFTLEYILRIYIVRRASGYIFSFFGVVDLFAILPTYLSLFFPGAQSLLAIRGLRLIRIFRVLKLTRYTLAGRYLRMALVESGPKITVFLLSVLTSVIFIGSLMYLVEGKESSFSSIPQSIYWAVATVTTVGYGDIVPTSVLGKTISVVLMIFGYGIIAVPTGIVSVELANVSRKVEFTRSCPYCTREGHRSGAKYCDDCGQKLDEKSDLAK